MVLVKVDLSCLLDIREEVASRQLYKWDWSSMERSRQDMRVYESSISVWQ